MPTQTDFDSKLNALVADHLNGLISEITTAIRRDIAAQLTPVFSGSAFGAPKVGRATKAPAAGRVAKKRTVKCIAPSCSSPSKGPRFHYLCEQHKSASKKEYTAWRNAK